MTNVRAASSVGCGPIATEWVEILWWVCCAASSLTVAPFWLTALCLIVVQYLPALRLSQADILDVFSGIQFQPLDKNTYLRVQCFINQLEACIPELLCSVLLYNDSLVWSVFLISCNWHFHLVDELLIEWMCLYWTEHLAHPGRLVRN